MGKVAFVFPGQGAQAVGMGKDAYEQEDLRSVFVEADRVLGYGLSNLMFEGPEEELKLTYHTQPALLTTSVAYWKQLDNAGIRPDYVAGHSLGEYSALVAAGVLRFEDAVKTVRLRGEYMDEAVPAGQGAMAAVLGADRDRLGQLCRDISDQDGVVEMANVNAPGQIVVSGSAQGVDAVAKLAKEGAGAKRVIPLEVSGPFHSSLMEPAAKRLEEHLSTIPFQDASIPVIANVTAKDVRVSSEIRELLVRQVTAPVLWEDSIRTMLELGVDTFVEIGSGSVLTGLIRKIRRDVKIYTVNHLAAAAEVATSL